MDVCVIGAGYVGLVTGACLAYLDNRVALVEADKSRLERLTSGLIPFYEPGLQDLLRQAQDKGFIDFSDNLEAAVKRSEIVFIAVGTPSQADGQPDLSQVVGVARAIGAALDGERQRVIVNKSTVPVGSGNWVEMLVSQGLTTVQVVPARSARPQAPHFAVVSNPEFLREGTAIADSLYPDRIVVGAEDGEAVEKLRELYSPILMQDFDPPAAFPRPPGVSGVPFLVTDLASAEMIKYSANAFLAMKISFANEMAGLCEKVGADIRQVMQGIGLDKRIGASFLNAGVGWGGSCFGKDVSALIEMAREYGCPTALLEATLAVNQRQRSVAITKLQEELKIIKGRTVGLLGLSFKPNTDDLRDAPSLTIAAHLLRMGAQVKAYDPVAAGACFAACPELDLVYCHSIDEACENADALVLVTEWEEFLHADWQRLRELMRRPVLIDGRNFLPEKVLKAAGFIYRGIGR